MENINNLKETNDYLKKMTEQLKQIDILKNMEFNFGTEPLINAMGLFTELDTSIKIASDGIKLLEKNGLSNTLNDMTSKGSILSGILLNAGDSIKTLTSCTDVHTFATTLCTMATTAFGAALEFLKTNPLVAVVGAIGLAVGALSLFSGTEEKAKTDTDLLSEAQAKKRKELEDTTKAIKDQTSSTIESAKEQVAQVGAIKGLVENLKGLTDNEGFFDSTNIEAVKYYIDEINSNMPGTVELTEDGRVNWLKNSEAIEDNIKQLERKAKVEAYYDGYVESLKNESKLRGELTLAQNNYNSELEKQAELQQKYDEIIEKSNKGIATYEELALLGDYSKQMEESNIKLGEYSSTLSQAKSAYEANKQGADLYQMAVQNMDETIATSAALMTEEMLVIGQNGTSTWASLAAAREDCKTRMLTAEGEEKEAILLANELINAETINKAMVFGDSYDKMISNLKEKGAILSEDEEKQLKASYDMWKMSTDGIYNAQKAGLDTLALMKSVAMSNMAEEDKKKLAENVRKFAEAGNVQGLKLCQNLADGLSKNNGQVNDETNNLMNQMDGIIKNKKLKATVTSDTDKDSVDKSVNTVKKAMNGIGSVFVGIKSLFGFADGGFPDTGELFVAREAGPELVGRINGKTAVANNDQIVSGISSGVYNAMIGAMSKGNRNNTTVTAIFQVDGKQVAKQVINAHNKEVMQTGRSPLLI
ncbi:MAG: hypothetical protein ACLR9T_00940 [Thomasclavelia sp.]|uniref:hypothetical protein n=1 Tax=Thomasclavelia sp. TaxID=3025757 RepID=UPI00399F7191